MRNVVSFLLNFVFALAPIKQRKIVFETGTGKVDGNPYAIYAYIKAHCPNDFTLIWLAQKDSDIHLLDPRDVVYYKTFSAYFHQATAQYWIRSHSVGSLLKKKQRQIYLQTWHGGGAFKKCGYDIMHEQHRTPMEHVKEWDCYIASDPYNASMIQTSTGYDNAVRVMGLARSDELFQFDDAAAANIRNHILHDRSTGKHIILYAPTFREKDLVNEEVDLPIASLSTVKDACILVRLHPQVKDKLKREQLAENMVDVSGYPNMQDLLLIADVVITDYSSLIFDYALLQRPMIFYTYDFDAYMKERDGFYLDFNRELPGVRVNTEQELYRQVCDLPALKSQCEEPLIAFNQKYNEYNNGHVCERIVQKLYEPDYWKGMH